MSDTVTKNDWVERVLKVRPSGGGQRGLRSGMRIGQRGLNNSGSPRQDAPMPPPPRPRQGTDTPPPPPPREGRGMPPLPPLPRQGTDTPPPRPSQGPEQTGLSLKARFDAAAARAQASFDAAERILAATPLPDEVEAVRTAYEDASVLLAISVNGPEIYDKTLADLRAKEEAARAVLNAKAQADAAALRQRQVATQKGQYDEMKDVCDAVVRTYFNPNAAASTAGIRKEKLSPGKHFKVYLDALGQLEQTRGTLPRTGPIPPETAQAVQEDCDALIQAAEAYLTHYETDFSDRQKRDKDNKRKAQIASEGIKAARHFALAMQMQAIAEPTPQAPWDRETALRAGGLRAAISFETGYKKGGNLSEEGAAGASTTFWVESKPPGESKATKNFIFKPVQGEVSPAPDDAPGSGAAREALAFANANLFAEQTGIDLGVPETHVTSIGAYALDLKDNEADGQPRVGSLQGFAPSDGALGEASLSDRRQIPGKECQKIALHDIMALNFDRHSGNLLMQTPPGGGAPTLVPIDHGGTLPSRKDFDNMAPRIGGVEFGPNATVTVVQNAMLGMPGAYENFDPETQAKLELLDPDAMVQGMRDQLTALDQVNPGLDSRNKVDDERLDMSKRSMMFLKIAARDLSPAIIQIAIGQHGAELFDAEDTDFDDVAAGIVAEMKDKGPAYAEIFLSSAQRRDEIFNTLKNNGWTPPEGGLAKWVMANPEIALKLYKAGAVREEPAPDGRDNAPGIGQDPETVAGSLDDAQVLQQSIDKLLAQTDEHLTDVDGGSASSLNTLRADVQNLVTAGDIVGAESKARELENEAMHLGLIAARAEGDRLFAQREIVFQGMGSNEEEVARRQKMPDGDEKQAAVSRYYRRLGLDKAYKDLQFMTARRPDLIEARTQLQNMRRQLGLTG